MYISTQFFSWSPTMAFFYSLHPAAPELPLLLQAPASILPVIHRNISAKIRHDPADPQSTSLISSSSSTCKHQVLVINKGCSWMASYYSPLQTIFFCVFSFRLNLSSVAPLIFPLEKFRERHTEHLTSSWPFTLFSICVSYRLDTLTGANL